MALFFYLWLLVIQIQIKPNSLIYETKICKIMKIKDLKELKTKNPKKFIKEIIKLNINRDETPEVMEYVDNEVKIERESTLETSILYNNIQEFKLILEPKALIDYEFAMNVRSAITDGFLRAINKGVRKRKRITMQKLFITYCPLELRVAYENTSEINIKIREATKRIIDYYIKELGRLPRSKSTKSARTEKEKKDFLEETRIADYLGTHKLYLTNSIIKKFCVDTFVTDYLTRKEQFDIFKKYVKENGWPKQDQGNVEIHTLSHRLYHWAKRLLTKIEPSIVEKQYPGFLEFAERYHISRRTDIKKRSELWSDLFIEWCKKINDYPRPKYYLGKNKIPKAEIMSQLLVKAYNPGVKNTSKLSEEESELIRKTAESYGYKYVSGGLKEARKKLLKENYFEEYISWVKQNKKLPKTNSSNEEEYSLAKYRYNHKNDERIIQINTLVKYLEISDKAKELLENY